MIQKLASITIILGSLFIAVVTWSGSAMAADGKLYPGLMCVPERKSPPFEGIRYGHDGGVSFPISEFDIFSGWRVMCPIIKDEHKDGQGIRRVRVYYTNNHAGSSVNCSVYTKKHGGGILETVSAQGQTGSVTSTLEISGSQISHDGEFYYMSCFLPFKTNEGESTLHAYYVEEK